MSRRVEPHGLRRRVLVAFGLFAFALATLFGIFSTAALYIVEDGMVARTLELELEHYLGRRAQDAETPLPTTRWLNSTLDPDALPSHLQEFADSPDGIYEISLPFTEVEPFLRIHTLGDGQRLYLYVNAVDLEVIDESIGRMVLALLTMIAGITLIGLLLGHFTARRVIAPVTELARRVRRLEQEPDAVLSSDGFADDEVGLLARTLATSTARSRAFLDRERRFTRDASHELRSPVTVVRGAVELLEAQPEAANPKLRRPLDRIRRAMEDMARLIDAFLWLAREEDLSEGRAPRSLTDEARKAVERSRHLLEGKDVEWVESIDPEATVEAPEGVLGIVLGNLVANACFYTQEGRIVLRGDAQRFEVEDTGPGIDPDLRQQLLEPHQRGRSSEGFGLGLAIARDLCERFDWHLTLEETQGASGTLATVHFECPGKTSDDRLNGAT